MENQLNEDNMKKNMVSILLNLAFLVFLSTTFFLQYEFLFFTRIVSILFAIVYLIMELKKTYFSLNKPLFMFISAVSIIAVILSILHDSNSVSNEINDRSFLIPLFVFVLLGIMHKDLYDKKKTTL